MHQEKSGNPAPSHSWTGSQSFCLQFSGQRSCKAPVQVTATAKVHPASGISAQGSMLQISISAEHFSDQFSAPNFGRISTPKKHLKIYYGQ
jgi:hypothetical protein